MMIVDECMVDLPMEDEMVPHYYESAGRHQKLSASTYFKGR